ncbi:MAG: hypothetical protein IPP15_20290 [Saprospiraceae bacterium]|uniref:Sialidase N-terminal domain-containing protein n=1 Tax=Candidatus Opimibacter skivensis TaxID=2982028 RepID=A0A9D7XS51_9BACT|nr:hypothetical protein [Candidatus Opimibacter skivensis]
MNNQLLTGLSRYATNTPSRILPLPMVTVSPYSNPSSPDISLSTHKPINHPREITVPKRSNPSTTEINRSPDHSITRSLDKSLDHSITRSLDKSLDHLITRSLDNNIPVSSNQSVMSSNSSSTATPMNFVSLKLSAMLAAFENKKSRFALRGVLLIAMIAGYVEANAQVDVTASGGTLMASYTTLKGAFDAINAGTHTGTITIGISANPFEGTASIVLNASGSGLASYTSISISPTGGAARTISAATTAGSPMIDFNGADNVTIDGLNTGGNSLTIANTTASATSGTSTIRFILDATNNTITNCNLKGSVSSSVVTNGAVVFFSTGTSTGNDNNTISNNNIGPSGANLPTKAILGNGSTTTTAIGNSGILITNNNIFDYFGAAVTSSGVAINGGCNTWSITNNRFYQTATRTETTAALHSSINMNSSAATSGVQGMTITGNIIGYSSNTQTGTYALTGAVAATFRGISFTGIAGGTVSNINSNTIANISLTGVTSSGTSSSAPMMGIYVSSGNTIVSSNTIGSQSVTGSISYSSSSASASDINAICNFGVDNWTTNNNLIGGITAANTSTGASNVYGLRVSTGATVTWTCTGNTVGGTVANSIQSTTTATGTTVQGILNILPIGTISTNTICNLTAAGGTGTTSSAAVIGISNTSTANQTISQNTIFNLTASNTTAASVVTGIQFTGSTANTVERNLIYNLLALTSSASAEINGIRVAGGTTTYRNNMIALGANQAIAIGAVASNAITTGINGINEANGTDNFYHNSIYIGGTATSGSGASYAFNGTQTTNTRAFRDNIFQNARTNSGATGKHYAVKINGTTPNPTGLTINNNVYFSNGASGAVFGFFNSADVANLSAWKTAVGQDAASIEANPQYNDPTNATPDLHIHPTNPSPAEATGVDVGVTDDYDGQTRSGLTPVDIGADAGNFVAAPSMTYVSSTTTQNNVTNVPTNSTNQEVIGIQIVTSGALNPLSATSFSINVGGTSSLTDITNAKIYYTGNSSTFAATGQFGSTLAVPTSSFVVTGTVALSQGTNYFWLTYDVPCGSMAGNTIDGECTSLTVVSPQTPTITNPGSGRVIVAGPLNGTYSVGTGQVAPNYATLTAAIADLNSKGISGNTTFNILTNLTEAGTVSINQFIECGGSGFTLTIKPATTATISGAVASGALIKLNGADRVTIDGSNSGGTDRSLTITNTSTTSPTAVALISLGAGAGASDNTIKNCNISTGVSGAIGYGVAVGGSTPGTSGADNDNVTIQNNAITVATIGIYAIGTASVSTGGNDNLAITGNSVDYNGILASIGIQVGNSLTSSVSLNTVSEQTTTTQAPTGISLETGFVSSSVTRNTITKSLTTNTGGYGGRGITIGTGTATSSLTIANNFISGVNGSNFSGFSNSSAMGIGIGMIGNSSTISTTTGGINLYYNSVNIYGTYSSSTNCLTAAIYVGSGASALDIRNNIFVNTLNNTGTGTTSKAYSIYSAAAITAFATINNNDYYVSGTQGVLGFIGSDRTTLTAIVTGFGGNANSVTGNPQFLTNADLHISTSLTTPVESAANNGTVITIDIDADLRNGSTPDIGADEGTFIAPVANDIQATAFIDPTNGGSKITGVAFSPQASFTNNGTATQTSVPVRYKIIGPSPAVTEVYNQTGTIASIATGITSTVTFPSATIAAAGTYTIQAISELPGDGVPGNDQISGTLTVLAPLCGTYHVGSAQTAPFNTITNAIGVINTVGVTCAVTFLLDDAIYPTETFPLTINAFTGASPSNTLTIRPASGVTASVSGSINTTLFDINNGDFVIIDGSNNGTSSKNLTISNTNTSGAVVRFINDATNNTVKNTILNGVSTSTSNGIVFFSTTTGTTGNDNNAIQNNDIAAGATANAYGIYNSGTTTTTALKNSGLQIIGNNIFNFSNTGIFDAGGSVGTIYSANQIYEVNIQTTSLVGFRPSATNIEAFTFTRNRIYDLKTSGTGTVYGVHLFDIQGNASLIGEVSNNMISLDATAPLTMYGIYDQSATGEFYNVYFNTISISGAVTGASNSIAYNWSIASTSNAKNNILSNTRTGGTGKHYAIKLNTTLANLTSDFNNIYNSGGTANVFGNDGTADRANLLAWQTAISKDLNSKSVQPIFTSATDLHLGTNSNCTLDGTGVTIGSISIDYDSDTRNSPPDIGADEFTNSFATVTVGPNQSTCTSATLAGSAVPSGGTGLWTVEAGTGSFAPNANDPAAVVSGLTLGVNTFKWTVTSGSCSGNASVNITKTSPVAPLGTFRTVVAGNWNNTATWENSDGCVWVAGGIPGATNNVIILHDVTLDITTTVNNLTLTAGELSLGANNLTVTAVTGTSSSFVVTDGSGALKVNAIGASDIVFPVGPTSGSYNPVTVNNAGTSDNFSIKVKTGFDFMPFDPTKSDQQTMDRK